MSLAFSLFASFDTTCRWSAHINLLWPEALFCFLLISIWISEKRMGFLIIIDMDENSACLLAPSYTNLQRHEAFLLLSWHWWGVSLLLGTMVSPDVPLTSSDNTSVTGYFSSLMTVEAPDLPAALLRVEVGSYIFFPADTWPVPAQLCKESACLYRDTANPWRKTWEGNGNPIPIAPLA